MAYSHFHLQLPNKIHTVKNSWKPIDTPYSPPHQLTMRGNDQNCKVHLKKGGEDFIVMADSAKAVHDWRADRTIAMAQVVSGWKIFTTHG